MTNNYLSPRSAKETLEYLDSLSYKFRQSAENKGRDDINIAVTLEEAAQALRAERAKSQQLQAELAALQLTSALKQAGAKGKSFTFFVDGSGSMTSPYHSAPAGIKTALDGIDVFEKATGANSQSVLWGDETLRAITDKKQAEEDIGGPSYFAPAVDQMQKTASASQKRQHFVVVSDGDLYDDDKALSQARALLASCPKVTLDFVVMEYSPASPMGRVAKDLQQQFPAQVGLQVVAAGQPIHAALASIAAQRTPKTKKKSQPQPKQ